MSDARPERPPGSAPTAPRGRLGSLLHRLFFRDEHHRELLLLDLIDDLSRCRDEHELAQDVCLGLLQALAPDSLHLFCRRGSRFRLIYSSSEPLDRKTLMPSESQIPVLAADWSEPNATRTLGNLPADDRSWLRSWSAEWVVALQYPPRTKNGVVGLLLLGRRADGYSTVLRDLLQTLADRTAQSYVSLIDKKSRLLLAEQGAGRWLKECPECRRCFGSDAFYCPDDDSVLEPTILIERVIGGRYALERNLGKGGMGLVYAARDEHSAEEVAVKLLTGGDRVALGRFSREAKAGKVLKHPNIVQVLDSGELQGGAFMVMEYVEGVTLRQVMEEQCPIEPPRVARWFDQILSGVAVAHEHGVIHRDLKPDNVMMTGEGGEEIPKVLDFGLAKLRDGASSGQYQLTAAGMVIGTLSYMSPEQLAAEPIDHRTDIFAIGVMVCEALTGKPPFWSENLGQMLRAVASAPFRLDVETIAQARVTDVLGRALAKSPEDRYADAESFRRDLIPALENCETFPPPEPPL